GSGLSLGGVIVGFPTNRHFCTAADLLILNVGGQLIRFYPERHGSKKALYLSHWQH
ncbi:MAG: hypothetical protein HC887_08215, partial [Desulfobacteraceae bacterium]|nr:hypothetical protein [Desulfobacteraceae bacterium]